jgi:hypothetical protein
MRRALTALAARWRTVAWLAAALVVAGWTCARFLSGLASAASVTDLERRVATVERRAAVTTNDLCWIKRGICDVKLSLGAVACDPGCKEE